MFFVLGVVRVFDGRYGLIIGVRAQQIASAAPILVELTPELLGDPVNIAEKELREGKIDMIIRRRLPNDRHEDWNVKELALEEEF